MVVSNVFYFHPYLGKIPNLIDIFQTGGNHQLDEHHFYPTDTDVFQKKYRTTPQKNIITSLLPPHLVRVGGGKEKKTSARLKVNRSKVPWNLLRINVCCNRPLMYLWKKKTFCEQKMGGGTRWTEKFATCKSGKRELTMWQFFCIIHMYLWKKM